MLLEAGFPLDAPGDEQLDNAGITIWARVEVDAKQHVHNKVVFRRTSAQGNVVAEGTLDCIHLAVYAAPLSKLAERIKIDPGFQELAESTEGRPVDLPPGEHFFALKSYVGGVASMGVFSLLKSGPQPGFNTLWHSQVIEALHAVGALEPLITFYQKSHQVQPDQSAIHFNLGEAYRVQGNLERAAAAFKIVTRLSPRSLTARICLGDSLRGLGRLDEAAQTYREALEIAPENPQVQELLTLLEAVQQDLDDISAILKHRPELREVS